MEEKTYRPSWIERFLTPVLVVGLFLFSLQVLHGDLVDVRNDLREMRTEVQGVRTEIVGLRSDLKQLSLRMDRHLDTHALADGSVPPKVE